MCKPHETRTHEATGRTGRDLASTLPPAPRGLSQCFNVASCDLDCQLQDSGGTPCVIIKTPGFPAPRLFHLLNLRRTGVRDDRIERIAGRRLEGSGGRLPRDGRGV